ncbi:putative sporulation protein YtaF [Paenibacillus sp. cl6col]|uniref:MntP/YtaF family protein n=1 Tax=Paenibacillus sp. cl6col TaxID=1761878 RepID=UPI00088635EA|nr:MntP/YtaF family protein [Paenibacillus sp. cl6col]SDF48715.1 putative sporulation protein YtaF [Paenibacillus sp. cl6col]
MLIHTVSLFILAFALSLDSFGVGMTYGLRRLRIPWTSIAVIACCSGLVILLSMQVGNLLIQYVSPAVAQWIGSLILVGIGCWAILQLLRSSHDEDDPLNHIASSEDAAADQMHISAVVQSSSVPSIPMGDEPKQVVRIQLKSLGVVIQILKTPSAADMDRSGTISAIEAAWLGVALSLDAFGAGIGAALLGYPALMTAIVIALFSGIFLRLGIHVGIAFAGARWIGKLSFVPGLMLIIMGIIKLLT